GTTNQLIELAKKAETGSWEECLTLIGAINERHLQIASELTLSKTHLDLLEATLKEMKTLANGINLLRECSARAKDKMQSIGERLSSILFTRAMEQVFESDDRIKWFDVRQIMITDSQHG